MSDKKFGEKLDLHIGQKSDKMAVKKSVKYIRIKRGKIGQRKGKEKSDKKIENKKSDRNIVRKKSDKNIGQKYRTKLSGQKSDKKWDMKSDKKSRARN